jgi:hypothetical protein
MEINHHFSQAEYKDVGALRELSPKLLFSGGEISMMQFFRALPASPQIALRAGFRNWNSTL